MPKIKSQEALVRGRKRWVMFAALALVIAGSYLWWKKGTLVSEEWSPNKEYVAREFKTYDFIPRMTMPGDGGHYSGYIRVYNKKGARLYEEYADLLDFIEGPYWVKEGVYWMGTDNQDIVRLPSSPVD
ncbi:hypothetical protein [Ewingella americana]|jgi:hypothetical protein|uniref:Uncharacterized protein n=1 Tax=Ewingella americana TaxID=41202 RepID=A0A502G5A9_9GAMM|nr:hypothetical protein [Ewingella americana]TPG57048.1 hypothetical protein EAH77_21770 [Ewingella americana]